MDDPTLARFSGNIPRKVASRVCVVTLASMPVSEGFAPCRSGTGEGEGRLGEPASKLGFHATADHSVSFRLLSATEFGTRGSEVQILSPRPIQIVLCFQGFVRIPIRYF